MGLEDALAAVDLAVQRGQGAADGAGALQVVDGAGGVGQVQEGIRHAAALVVDQYELHLLRAVVQRQGEDVGLQHDRFARARGAGDQAVGAVILVGDVQHEGVGAGGVADDGAQALVGVILAPHTPDVQLLGAAHVVDVQEGHQRGDGGVLRRVLHAQGRQVPGEAGQQVAVGVFVVHLGGVAQGGVQLAGPGRHVEHQVALLGQKLQAGRDDDQRHAQAAGEQLAHDGLVLQEGGVGAEYDVVGQRQRALAEVLFVHGVAGVFLGGGAAHVQHVAQVGHDIVDRRGRGGDHAHLAVLTGEHVGQPAGPGPLGAGLQVGEHRHAHVVVRVHRGDLHHQALGEQRRLVGAQYAHDALPAQVDRHRRVPDHGVELLQALGLVAQRVVDDRELLLLGADLRRQRHRADAQAHVQEVGVGGHAVPQPVGAVRGQADALAHVGEVGGQALVFPGVQLLQLGLDLGDVLAVQADAVGLRLLRLLFAVAAVDDGPHDRHQRGGADHDQARGDGPVAGAGAHHHHGGDAHGQHHGHGRADLLPGRGKQLLLLGDGGLDLHLVDVRPRQHARGAVILDVQRGKLAVGGARRRRGQIRRRGKADALQRIRPVDGQHRAQIHQLQARGEHQRVAELHPHGGVQDLVAVQVGAVGGFIGVLRQVSLLGVQKAVQAADVVRRVDDVAARVAPDGDGARADVELLERQAAALQPLELEGDLDHGADEGVQLVFLQRALAGGAVVAPDEVVGRGHENAPVQRAYGDDHVHGKAAFGVVHQHLVGPGAHIRRIDLLELIAEQHPQCVHRGPPFSVQVGGRGFSGRGGDQKCTYSTRNISPAICRVSLWCSGWGVLVGIRTLFR